MLPDFSKRNVLLVGGALVAILGAAWTGIAERVATVLLTVTRQLATPSANAAASGPMQVRAQSQSQSQSQSHPPARHPPTPHVM
eukprot:119962-Prorocentrum_minimum.AAC.1